MVAKPFCETPKWVQYGLVESINVAVASNVTTAIYGLN